MGSAGQRGEALGGPSLVSLKVLSGNAISPRADGAEEDGVALSRWVEALAGAGAGEGAGADLHGVGGDGARARKRNARILSICELSQRSR